MNEKGNTKIESARRLVNAAIRMLFRQDDPLAVHTVAMAGFRVLRDLAIIRGLEHPVDSMIRPEMEREFWGVVNAHANFLKHADRDPVDVLTPFPEHPNDPQLLIASSYYEVLRNPPTLEMWVLLVWYRSVHPDRLSQDVSPAMLPGFHLAGNMQHLPRKEQLAAGSLFMEKVLAQPQLDRLLANAWE
ncbi:MAG: hypothetical protein OXC19_13205 [Bryobacterales bacterium]|nr:hypothetical protein [Bryobacterales bacterium]